MLEYTGQHSMVEFTNEGFRRPPIISIYCNVRANRVFNSGCHICISGCVTDPTRLHEILGDATFSEIRFVTGKNCSCNYWDSMLDRTDIIECDYDDAIEKISKRNWTRVSVREPIDVSTPNLKIVDTWDYHLNSNTELTPEIEKNLAKIKKLTVTRGSIKLSHIPDHHFEEITFYLTDAVPDSDIVDGLLADRIIFNISTAGYDPIDISNLSKVLAHVKNFTFMCNYGRCTIFRDDLLRVITPDIVCPYLVYYSIELYEKSHRFPVLDRWCIDNDAARFFKTKAIMLAE